jgi:predicted Rossmann fold flavoprotein
MIVAVIGAGAAGFFAAINCAINFPEANVIIFEKSNKVLSKVRVSGGGRCNVTNVNFDNRNLADYYPRGHRELRSAFSRFGKKETIDWFEERGVKLKDEPDGRMFPITNNSETIIHCLMNESVKNNVKIRLSQTLNKISQAGKGGFNLHFPEYDFYADKIIITTGGSPNINSYDWIKSLGHRIIPPVPSLFTFNIPGSPLKGLEGIAKPAIVLLDGFKFESAGPLLITHWGISGPAVLRLSAFASRWLNEKGYTSDCFINWLPQKNEEEMRNYLMDMKSDSGKRKVLNTVVGDLPTRLWSRLCVLAGISEDEKWADLNKSKMNALNQNLVRFKLSVRGKTTFKEEFVTCGGVSLEEVDMKTMQSKKVNGIYFAGEVLDIDGITGGFNFQAAWTTGFLAGTSLV